MPPASDAEASPSPIETEAVIIGAGPAGLFQVFELGLLGIKAHMRRFAGHPGGQCTELYPDKPIYDIPALPVCGAQELVDRLLQQIKPFEPQCSTSARKSRSCRRRDDGRLTSHCGRHRHAFLARTVVIAAGLGSFQPSRLGVEGCERSKTARCTIACATPRDFHGQRLVIFGGGDSALDWVLDLMARPRASCRCIGAPEFRAAPASVARMRELVAAGKHASTSRARAAASRSTTARLTGGHRQAHATATCRTLRRRPRAGVSSACIRSWVRSRSGASSWRRRRSRSTRRSSRPACRASSPSATSTPIPARRS